jgi:hypothetical protein
MRIFSRLIQTVSPSTTQVTRCAGGGAQTAMAMARVIMVGSCAG